MKTHGMTDTPTYKSWNMMLVRCRGKYKSKGISVDPRWISFADFYADMGDRPAGMTLDRIDNKGDYEPSNCRWASPRLQQLNRGIQTNNTSGYQGIRFRVDRKKWYVSIGRGKHIGVFLNLKDAITARQTALQGE